MGDNKVLVFPRAIFHGEFSLLPWESVQMQIEEIESSFSWLNRSEAERSTDLVQAIPCAFIRDRSGKCYVLRHAQNARNDLSRKLSLIVGGHIDESQDMGSFQGIMSLNLVRELEEEVLLLTKETPRPVGVIIDDTSLEASRHVAFLHEVAAEDASLRVSEEFAKLSKRLGEFMPVSKLATMRDDFDPWSRLLIEEHICRDMVSPQPRQHSFL